MNMIHAEKIIHFKSATISFISVATIFELKKKEREIVIIDFVSFCFV